MTMQMMDSFSYRGERAETIAISRRFSFSPANNFGIAVTSWATSNYRGFWCDYSIDESLVINNLYLFSKDHLYPPVNGRKAEEIAEFRHLLDDINEKVRIPKNTRTAFQCNILVLTMTMNTPEELYWVSIQSGINQAGKI
jgi:hypothetical protein